jgi:glycosyltransferase involved in cell wall biosynthesis
VLCISRARAAAAQPFTPDQIRLTPFGVDTSTFRPRRLTCPYFPEGTLVIGTIKGLTPDYGIDVLIRAFADLVKRRSNDSLGLLICGEGPERDAFVQLAADLGISSHVHFTGRLSHDLVADHHAMIDIFANLSRTESFGVSVVEASATGRPVVATRVGGLPEVVEHRIVGAHG